MSVTSTSNRFQVYENQHLPNELWTEILSEVASLSTRLVCKQFRDVTDYILKRKTIKYVRQLGLCPKFDKLHIAGYTFLKLYMILINHIKDRAFNLGIATDDEFKFDELLKDCDEASRFHKERFANRGDTGARLWHIPGDSLITGQYDYYLELPNNFLSELPNISHTQLNVLDLSKNRFIRFPEIITNWSKLHNLSLSNNRLTSIPSSISRLIKLDSLLLDSNNLQSLPQSISKLHDLYELDLSNNQIVEFPNRSLNRLSNLDELHLSNNYLTAISLPKNLRTLDLSGNRFKTFPTLPESLISLDLSSNQLKTLPSSITLLTCLAFLNLSHNRIGSIEPDIQKLHLWDLNLSHNLLAELPPLPSYLRKLDISHNLLTELPESTSLLDKLKILDASHNAISRIFAIPRVDELNLSHNQLLRVTIRWRFCIRLDLSNNPLTDLNDYHSLATINNTPYKLEFDNSLLIRLLKQLFLIYLIRYCINSMKRFEVI